MHNLGKKAPSEQTALALSVLELQRNSAEILQELRRGSIAYLTDEGKTIGALVPIVEEIESPGASVGTSTWDTLERLGEEIGKGWQSSKTSDELLSEMRR